MGLHEQLSAVDCVEAGANGDKQSMGNNHGLGWKAAHSSGQRLDVNFNTDPMFVRAGQNGIAVPRGLSAVESDTAVPVLKFKSDDAYATAAELSRRASAAKEMRAALAAQISAKRMVTSKAFNADDHYEVSFQVDHHARVRGYLHRRGSSAPLTLEPGPIGPIIMHQPTASPPLQAHVEASRTLDFQDAAYASPRPLSGPLSQCRSDGRSDGRSDSRLAPPSFRGSPSPTACSLTAREAREPFAPSPRGSASDSFHTRGPAIPARRAAAAREIQGALDAQMRAAALLQARMDASATTSSDAASLSSVAVDGEPSPLVRRASLRIVHMHRGHALCVAAHPCSPLAVLALMYSITPYRARARNPERQKSFRPLPPYVVLPS